MKRKIILLLAIINLVSLFFYGCVSEKNSRVETTASPSEEIEEYDAQIDWGNGHSEKASNGIEATEASISNTSELTETEESVHWTEAPAVTETTAVEMEVDKNEEVIVGVGDVGSGGEVEWE